MTANAFSGRLGILLMLSVVMALHSCRNQPYDTSMYYIQSVDADTRAISLIEHPYILEELGLKLDRLSYLREGELVWMQASLSGNVEQYRECLLYVHAYPEQNDERFLNLGGELALKDGELQLSRRISLPQRSEFAELRFGLGCQKQRKFSISLKDVIFE